MTTADDNALDLIYRNARSHKLIVGDPVITALLRFHATSPVPPTWSPKSAVRDRNSPSNFFALKADLQAIDFDEFYAIRAFRFRHVSSLLTVCVC